MMEVDMSPEAVTVRMEALNQLWELTVALQSSELIQKTSKEKKEQKNDRKQKT
jgi:hypothetical protein